MTDINLQQSLVRIKSEDYGPEYRNHLLEQYKLYVDMADKISQRRQTANSFFLSINTALIGLVGIIASQNNNSVPLLVLILGSVVGLTLCYSWYRLIRSYKDLNTGKFEVIHEIEQLLPIAPYDAEWAILGEGTNSKLYKPFTYVEIWIPRIFMVGYSGIAIYSLAIELVAPLLYTFFGKIK